MIQGKGYEMIQGKVGGDIYKGGQEVIQGRVGEEKYRGG